VENAQGCDGAAKVAKDLSKPAEEHSTSLHNDTYYLK
jgi:hypothetical protein